MGFFSKLCGKKKDAPKKKEDESVSETPKTAESTTTEPTVAEPEFDTKKSDDTESATCTVCHKAPKADKGDLCDACNEQVT